MRWLLLSALSLAAGLLLAALVGCEEPPPRATVDECNYPEGAVEPMAQGEVLTPYSWPSALDGERSQLALDLQFAPCDTDPELDWSPFDVLLFVSIPAW